VDAVELLEGDTPFIADTSAWWRFSSLPPVLAGLVKRAIGDDRLWITPRFRILRNDRTVADAAMSAVGELAERSDGYHRLPLTDALIAAAAA
jgi:hypothetical protein